MNIEKVKIKDLKEYEKNAKQHPQKQIEQIKKSILEFGFNDPIAIDENNQIIEGHGRLYAIKELGYNDVDCIRLSHLTEEQKRAYILVHNKLTMNTDFDMELLENELSTIIDINMEDFDFDLSFLEEEKEIIEDDLPEGVEPRCKLGDIWELGNHRLMCGDSTKEEDVLKLMNNKKADMAFTDPPYNTGMKESSSPWLSHMFNDSFTDEEWIYLLENFTKNLFNVMDNNSVAYICLDWRRNYELIPHIKNTGFNLSNTIVWDKVVHGLGSDYKYTYELINVCKKGKPKLDTHKGDREYSDVWHIQRKMGKDKDHATKKPIELITRSISHVLKNTNVLDLFGGSGSTLIACEQLNKNCFMMEFDPKYCDLTIQRWENLTGKKATLIENGDDINV